MAFVTAAKLAELVPGVGAGVTVAGVRLALFLTGGVCYAVSDGCPHRDLPLAEGACEGDEVVCPFHGARFDLATGAVRCGPAERGIRTYPVRVAGDEVQVDVAGG